MSAGSSSNQPLVLADKAADQVISVAGPISGQYWRYPHALIPAFDAAVFDERELASRGLINGTADAGRGNTFFLTLNDAQLVLRHYRRGGFVRHFSKKHYLFTGLARTRAYREFDILLQLQALQLPAPIPYACQVVQKNLFYQASLVTYRLPGQTLVQRMVTTALSDAQWQSVGETIARFHRHGIYHADLNANNIMMDEQDNIAVIDFDRACIRPLPAGSPADGWCGENIKRLERSLIKISVQSQTDAEVAARGSASVGAESCDDSALLSGVSLLKKGWHDAMQISQA